MDSALGRLKRAAGQLAARFVFAGHIGLLIANSCRPLSQ
jgi:hypothetical protein